MYKRLVMLISLFCCASSVLAAGGLYPGEQLIEVNQTQSLIKFVKGSEGKPLIVFVPGDSHLARIAYGHPGANPKDFLAYWIHEKGYSFLAVSYPMDNPVYSKTYPEFTIQDWGNLVAAAAAKIIQENHLSKHVIVVGWSMGGSIEETVNAAAKKQGLVLDAFIGLAAVPPLPYVMQVSFGTDKMLANKLADRGMLPPIFYDLVKEQDKLNQHEIIPQRIYIKEYLGNFPTALSGEGYYYQDGKFILDVNRTLADGGVYNFAETPWIAIIRDDAASTAKLSLIDPASWNFLRAEMVYKQYLSKRNLTGMPENEWRYLRKKVESLPEQLTMTVHGNHFFIIGEKGAKETVDDIEILTQRIKQLAAEIAGVSIGHTARLKKSTAHTPLQRS